MDENFLLKSEEAKTLYNKYVKDLPIIDYHNHLSVYEIACDYQFRNLTDAWLSYDHYKWRLMRCMGYEESYITGAKPDEEKFRAFCNTMTSAVGSNVLVWAQMELEYFFNINNSLNNDNCSDIYSDVNNKLKSGNYNTSYFIEKSNVEILCTTDMPSDNLEYHKKINGQNRSYCVLPTFRPDKFLSFDDSVLANIKLLESACQTSIKNLQDYINALENRLIYFKSVGCVLSDHGIDQLMFTPCEFEEASILFDKSLKSKLDNEEINKLWSYLTVTLLKLYKNHGIKVQLHIGPIRNTNKKQFEKIGSDSGYDSIGNSIDIHYLTMMFNIVGDLPDIIIYNINPSDNYKIATLCNNYSTPHSTIKYGAAWWFNDNLTGIINQMTILKETGLFGEFLGMLTDSRSVLSMRRHDFFRRVLCTFLAQMYIDGVYFSDLESLGKIASNICYYNIKNYLGV